MESLAALSPNSPSQSQNLLQVRYTHFEADLLIIQNSIGSGVTQDTADAAIDDLSKSLSIKAQKIVDKLNELLKSKLPNGIESLSPEEVTPEATAERIVTGAVSLFEAYARQNPNLDPEQLLKNFMSEVRKGVDSGYSDAYGTLESLGAFEFNGVKEGIEKTKGLIEEKLQAFEKQKRQDLGLDPATDSTQVSSLVRDNVLSQAGARTLNLSA